MTFKNSVFIVRHGETEWKLQGRTQGQADSPLTPKGIAQVQKLANSLKVHAFDLIITSPLGRTRQTTKILADVLNIVNIQQSAALQERHEGALQGLTKNEQRQQYPNLFDKKGHLIHNANIPEGEPLPDFLKRVQKGIQEIAIQSQSHHVLVVTHAGVMQAIEAHIQQIPFSNAQRRYTFCEILKLQ